MPVWQKAHELAVEVFGITVNLPRSEDYGLTSPTLPHESSRVGGKPSLLHESSRVVTKQIKFLHLLYEPEL